MGQAGLGGGPADRQHLECGGGKARTALEEREQRLRSQMAHVLPEQGADQPLDQVAQSIQEAQRKAQEVQDRIKKWSEQYPNVICYCFDSFSTLLYVL